MKTTAFLLLLAALFAPLAAGAAQLSDGEIPVATVAVPVGATPETSADPNIDRAFILPTAMTQPSGSATYNNYELLLHGFTYGVTDRIQTTVTVLAPIVRDMPFVGIAAAKWQFLSTPRFHLALQASAGLGVSFTNANDASGYTVGAGAFATVCLREDCSSIASASATYQLAFAGSGGDGQVLIYGASIVHSVSSHVKLLAELTSLATRDVAGTGFDAAPGALASYGLRLHNANFASDIGFVKPVGSDNTFLLGLPFVSVSYRWQ
jgi:hypothetical protein